VPTGMGSRPLQNLTVQTYFISTIMIVSRPFKTRGENMGDSDFPETGFVRVSQILAPNGPIPVSKST